MLYERNYFYLLGIFILIIGVIYMIFFNKKKEFETIIGIDFGSTFSGYSIILDSPNDLEIPEHNKIISTELVMFKPTEIGKIIGEEAKKFVKHNELRPHNIFFSLFKRNLNPENKFYDKIEASAP